MIVKDRDVLPLTESRSKPPLVDSVGKRLRRISTRDFALLIITSSIVVSIGAVAVIAPYAADSSSKSEIARNDLSKANSSQSDPSADPDYTDSFTIYDQGVSPQAFDAILYGATGK